MTLNTVALPPAGEGVQTEGYFLQCRRYIELNPVRAGMVTDPSEYAQVLLSMPWHGIVSELFTSHEAYYKQPGRSGIQRLRTYRALFKAQVEGELREAIRYTVNQGHALGNERFKDEMEALYGRLVKPAKMGRPRKSCI